MERASWCGREMRAGDAGEVRGVVRGDVHTGDAGMWVALEGEMVECWARTLRLHQIMAMVVPLHKLQGGVRPIAVGEVLLHLAVLCATAA